MTFSLTEKPNLFMRIFFAVVAISGLALVSGHVSGINVSQPLLKAYFPAPVEYGARGSRKFSQLIGGVKGAYVPRHGFVGFIDPLRYVPEFLFRVVKGGYNEGRYLDPDSFSLKYSMLSKTGASLAPQTFL